MDGPRICTKCKEFKPADDFYQTADGRRRRDCKACHRKVMRESLAPNASRCGECGYVRRGDRPRRIAPPGEVH